MLQCIISALKAEAEPLANFFGLKQNSTYDYPLYDGGEIKILCTGVGRKNISNILINFYDRIPKNTQTQFVNLGIAGGKKNECKIGECFIIDDVYDTGFTLNKIKNLSGITVFVWFSKVEPVWWNAVEVCDPSEWLVFPWENTLLAVKEEQSFQLRRGKA